MQQQRRCPDDGGCSHDCGGTSCFRVVTCCPLSGYGEDWTAEDLAANPASGLRPSVEAFIACAKAAAE